MGLERGNQMVPRKEVKGLAHRDLQNQVDRPFLLIQYRLPSPSNLSVEIRHCQ